MPAAGPTANGIRKAAGNADADGAGFSVVDVNDAVVRAMLANYHRPSFLRDFGGGASIGSRVGRGDVLDIAIWEAPPAALFGAAGGGVGLTVGSSPAGMSELVARSTSLPEQMVDSDGAITIPFVGRVPAAGLTPQDIAKEINLKLAGKAHQPQTIVRLIRNSAATVTILGDVAQSARIPLTSKGERVLDILASAGGVKQPVGRTTIQISRGAKVESMPLENLIRDPQENIRLEPSDVVTVLYQPYSFTALGATGKNEELPFEATGITLAQALGRVSGIVDARADVKGVFIFRMEDPSSLDPTARSNSKVLANGKIPVIYRINLKDPSSFFIAQTFPIRDKDMLYVSNAPLADVQKFVNVILPSASLVTTAAAVAAQ